MDFVFRLGWIAMVALIVALWATDSHAQAVPSGEVIESHMRGGGREAALGVGTAADATGEALDGLTWAGCKLSGWAAGGRNDRTATAGNAAVALVFRAPVALVGGSLCAASAVVAIPVKGFGYGFNQLARADEIP